MFTQELLITYINDAYTSLGFTPRGNQVDICLQVLESFLIKKKRNVVLVAGTGLGKSLVAGVISEVLNKVSDINKLPSIISMGTNVLATQYADSFEKLGKHRFFPIKGASNYSCNFMECHPNGSQTSAEDCLKSKLLDPEVDKYCRGCEYDQAKKLINKTENLITNYTYFMISCLSSNHLVDRKLHVFDEAHLLNDWFCTYAEIIVSVDLLNKYIKELSDVNGKCDSEIAALVMLKEKVASKAIDESNYDSCLEILKSVYSSIATTLNNQAAGLVGHDNIKAVKYEKMCRKYNNLVQKIDDLYNNKYEHVFDNTVPETFTVKVVFMGEMTQKLLTDYNLFMSATITEQYVYDVLELSKKDTEYILLDPVFPAENKKLFFIGKNALNFNSLKDLDVINTLKEQIKAIVGFHEGQKGLILVPSFYLGNTLVNGLSKFTKVFEHKSGMDISELVYNFKRHSGPGILVSPSIFEGLSFDDDHSRFQIITKAPFPSLGDKRIKYIADNYSSIFQEITLLKTLQGIGRSVRSPTDYCVTYMLDPAIKRLFDSKMNIWKSHYTVMTK